MDVGEIRDLVRRPSRRTARLTVAACLLLAVPIYWSIGQHRMTREALDRATAAERAAQELRGQATRDPSVRRSRHDDPREIERVRQLFEEMDGLSQARDQVDQALKTDRPGAPKEAPAPRD